MSEIKDILFNKNKESEQELSILFEQYKLYVELMDKNSARRYQANSFFLTVNSFAVTLLASLSGITDQKTLSHGWIVIAAISGVAFSFTWKRLILSYRQLNNGKFKIIHLLEKRLPARLFKAEWDVLNHGDGTVYKPFTKMEIWVPVVFIVLYIALGVYTICNLI